MRCPKCDRATTPRRNRQGIRQQAEPGTVLATLNDGTCFACYNQIRGWVRPSRSKSITFAPEVEYLPPRFTPEQIEDMTVESTRRWVDNYVSDRRRRGVNCNGNATAKLHNGGAQLADVK